MRYLEKRLKNSICCNRALTGQMHAQEGTLAHVIWQKWWSGNTSGWTRRRISNVRQPKTRKRLQRTAAAKNLSVSSRSQGESKPSLVNIPIRLSKAWQIPGDVLRRLEPIPCRDVEFKLKNLINHDPCTTRTCWHIIVICEHVSCRQRDAFASICILYTHKQVLSLAQCLPPASMLRRHLAVLGPPHICKGWSARPGCCAAVHLTSESEFVPAIYDAETTCDLARGCVKFNPPGNWCKSLQIEGWSYKEKLSCLVPSRYEYALSKSTFRKGSGWKTWQTQSHLGCTANTNLRPKP